MFGARTQRRHNCRVAALCLGGIAKAHREVAQPALMADAPDRAAFEAAVEFLLGPPEQLHHARTAKAVALVEIGHCCALGELVPWAYALAIVAAVHAVADQRP